MWLVEYARMEGNNYAGGLGRTTHIAEDEQEALEFAADNGYWDDRSPVVIKEIEVKAEYSLREGVARLRYLEQQNMLGSGI